MEEKKKKRIKISLSTFIIIIAVIAIIILGIYIYFLKSNSNERVEELNNQPTKVETNKINNEEIKAMPEYVIKNNSLGDFDLKFLKLENKEENKIYSPLSIKYTLGMLNEGTAGESKKQISNIIGDYKARKYINSENMSFANALFIRDTYQKTIREDFINNLKNKYNAEVVYDSFISAKKINSWINNKTLHLINNLLSDEDVNELNFALVNALAIDMDWENKFLDYDDGDSFLAEYRHEYFDWYLENTLYSNKFEDVNEVVSGMPIVASVNNYDIVNTLGEANIRKTVGDEFRKFLQKNGSEEFSNWYGDEFKNYSMDQMIEKYLDEYITDINLNYKMVDKSTDFLYYVDNNVKAVAKDLKQYNGTTLQYIGIMPETDLKTYINKVKADDIKKIINSLKEVNNKNCKDGVVTEIVGYIPKFKFDYQLDLMKDLENMGIKDVFDAVKADLSGITNEKAFIGSAVHKANVEFTQDGIKAAASTVAGGYGGGDWFDYLYEVPTEKIDLTFDKPYMFLIRDKETGEVWFAGTVYKPLLASEDNSLDQYGQFYQYSKFEFLDKKIEYTEE